MASYPSKAGSASGPASVVYVPMAVKPPSYDRYPKKQSIGLGAMQILFGVLSIVFNSVSLAFSDGLKFPGSGTMGHGFWCGALFIATGVIGIVAGKKKKKCEIVANMVMCIISASFTFYLVLYGASGAVATNLQKNMLCSSYADSELCTTVIVVVAMESCLAIIGVIEASLFIWGAVLGCKAGACCCSKSYQPMALTHEYVPLSDNIHRDDLPPTYEED